MVHAYTICQRHPIRATYVIALAGVGTLCANLSFAIALFFSALLPPRFWHGLELLQYMRVVVSSTVFEPKQRFEYWILVTLLATPISLLSLLVAIVLVSPLFPFCGSTLFLAGFPRPRRFWSSYETWHDGEDGCYYEHFFDALTLELPLLLGPASVLHQRSHEGGNDVYLVRVDDFLGLLEVLELSTDYCVVRFKGLELQETTSCHHLEASKLDDVIADAFDEVNVSGDDDGALHRLPSPRTFTPLLRTPIRMYTISTVTLTDFLDDPKCLDLIHETFYVTLVSELNRVTHGSVPEIWLSFPVSISGLDFVLKEFPTLYWDYLQGKNKKQRHVPNPRDILKADEIPVPAPSREPRRSSLKLAADAILRLVTHLKPVRASISAAPKAQTLVKAPDQRTASQKERLEIAYGLNATEAASVDYESLAKQRPTVCHGRRSFQWGDIESHQAESTPFVNPGVAVRASFLKDRWNKVTEFHLLAASCFAIVETLGFGVHEKRGPNHTFDCFQGNFPRSLENDWLHTNTTLYDVVVRAYRLAVKIGLDKFAQGDNDLYDTPDELEATIHHYQSKWHIGPRHTAMWKYYISTNRPNLFALTKNANGQYMSNVYTLGRKDTTLVALNRAACEGTWHGQALELLYMTNDDDERFSIQSNSQLLRNLLVQSADPPLGYPVYSTGAVFIKL
ncbi:hypothetical protein SPRG_16176 [Saprolegnia parasitica CBS 223.65]|uniref:Pecanex C-terminal domain-containing protein n=1 Tax=Saprolegnia parasitica (strain CBS 223.65) TaxID=695850 RepID=A0A067BP10_SAPPC|nr:hypothetical protein SPRG_16176 [Saprolegnia parasitica CBS 223.65]KDO18500.1 hypothetical protein SPRG_16176 [Saprolegnia parasitica CBS 223.65]|eukprot:XP_012210795.1 hypothetical protein SPRG_16176 [Saprolegnia parasitica CBS 223.65]